MPSSSDGRSERGRTSRADDLARRERELEQFRANIERLRRERAAKLDEFSALTRKKEEPRPPAAPDDAADELRTVPLASSASAEVETPVASEPFDRFVTPAGAEATEGVAVVELPDEDASTAEVAPPDESLDFGALAEEDTVVDAEPRRAANRRRTLAVALAGAAAVVFVTVWLWGPWSRGRTDAPGSSSTTPGDPGEVVARPDEPSREAPKAEPVGGTGPARVAARPLVVQLVTLRAVWVREVVDGRQTLGRTIPAGETLTLEADAAVTVRIGDAGAVRIRVNGRDRGLAGRDGQVLTASFDAKDR